MPRVQSIERGKLKWDFLQHDVDLKGLVYDTKANKEGKNTEKSKNKFSSPWHAGSGFSDVCGVGEKAKPLPPSQCE